MFIISSGFREEDLDALKLQYDGGVDHWKLLGERQLLEMQT